MMSVMLARPPRAPGWIAAAACLAAGRAAAAEPITSRDYAIDFYDGVAIGDTAQVGMGGAGAAHVVGSAGTLLNPSAPAVRPTTDADHWSWDYHLDWLTGKYSSDYDNNGVAADEESGASLLTGGLALRVGNWSGAVTATGQTAPIPGSVLEAQALRAKLVVARWIPRIGLAVGAGVQSVQFGLAYAAEQAPLFEISGVGLVAGATWVPQMENVRAGLALESGIVGGDVKTPRCDPEDCMGYILPREVESPGRVILGGAYRWAETAWNQPVGQRWRDERALTAAVDLVVTGPSVNGYGLEAFSMKELQRSGRSHAVSLRGGAEYEALPGRIRVRAGSYWEPGRFEGVGGRIHGTVGADLRLGQFQLWGPRRGRISGTADVAARYRNVAVSVGFWH